MTPDPESLLLDTESLLAAARRDMEGDSKTARAIDRNDAWEVIAEAARLEGFDDLAEALEEAAGLWKA